MYLYVPEGKTVTCTGANASGLTGGDAGIELTEGNTLYLIGGGTVLTANGDGTWTIASMPAFDVELQIEYETALALSETADYTAALRQPSETSPAGAECFRGFAEGGRRRSEDRGDTPAQGCKTADSEELREWWKIESIKDRA